MQEPTRTQYEMDVFWAIVSLFGWFFYLFMFALNGDEIWIVFSPMWLVLFWIARYNYKRDRRAYDQAMEDYRRWRKAWDNLYYNDPEETNW